MVSWTLVFAIAQITVGTLAVPLTGDLGIKFEVKTTGSTSPMLGLGINVDLTRDG